MEKEGEPTVKIPLSDVSDVIVMNVRRIGQSYQGGSYRSRNYGGFSISSSQQFGTVIFMVHGAPRLTWNNISDPYGLKNLVMQMKKRR
jgi:hypothetical protein